MDRIMLSKMMAEAKKESGIGINKFVFELRVLPKVVYSLEKAEYNYSMSRCIEYLDIVNYHIKISKEDKDTAIHNYEELKDWVISSRGQMLIKDFALKINYTRGMVSLVEHGKREVNVDYFLSIINSFGYTVSLVKHE